MTDQNDDQDFYDRCSFYLLMIERIEARKSAIPGNMKWINEQQNDIAMFKRLLGEHLGNRSVAFTSGSVTRRVSPCWIVSGQPPKHLKSAAREWLAAQGIAEANTSDLRLAIEEALEDGEDVPPGFFGLRVERSVDFTDSHDGFGLNQSRS